MKQIITKSIEWDMGHRVLQHKSKCRNIHGHRYSLEASIIGEVQSTNDTNNGMVIDFGDIKEKLKEVHDLLDHSFIVWEQDKDMLEFLKKINSKYYVANFTTTAENLAEHIGEILKQKIDTSSYRLHSIVLYETPTSSVKINYEV